ncbi:hypothetical protein WA1_44205 [Scytonema hofmannii PCC 7110]|uniref:Uncharacterized protein n=1 Tax=Scytonema hofmannii PCC 7110 TaxID=128403 RepID=A0A139WW76_9CYAN|nr:hypothetical protein [Scytonema hofmannii]KYC36688.1 hypothetical protein WA1_44205 [Scytonema hofmannii PCC 7110]
MSRPKIVAWIVGIYSSFVFLLGLNFNDIVNFLTPNVLSNQSSNTSKQVQIPPVVTAILLSLIGIAGTSILENWLKLDIEEEVKKQVAENRKNFQNEHLLNELKKYKTALIKVEEQLKNATIPSDISKECLEVLQQVPSPEELISNYNLAQQIKEWLDDKKNRITVRNHVFNQLIKQRSISIDKKYYNNFRENILECLNWLCDSLENATPINWHDEYQRRLTSAITAGMSDIQPYKEVINLINSRLADEFITEKQSQILEYYLNELSKKYEEWYANLRGQ